ncbi:unnamed protein product [Boreogadus saida]
MAAVEYGECPSIHTSRLARFEYGIQVLEVYLFSPDLNWNVLRTQILSAQYGQYGYWNTALVSIQDRDGRLVKKPHRSCDWLY